MKKASSTRDQEEKMKKGDGEKVEVGEPSPVVVEDNDNILSQGEREGGTACVSRVRGGRGRMRGR